MKSEDYTVDISRRSQWGNPFRHGTREERLKKFENYMRGRVDLMLDLPKLEGETLGCWCKPKKCHGDILIKLLEERK